MNKVTSVFLLICLAFNANAYQLFITCKNNRLTETDQIGLENFFAKFLKVPAKAQQELISTWCRDSKECMKDFESIIKLSSASYDEAFLLFKKNYEEISKKLEDKFVSSKTVGGDEIVRLSHLVAEVRSCEETKAKFGPESFNKNGRLITPYPYHNNYMYITGCNGVDNPKVRCKSIKTADAEKVIKESIIMGVDPYTTLALSMMEGTPEQMADLYLDPIGVMASLGCQAKQVANNSKDALNSFGTSYEVKAEIRSDEKLKKNLKKYFEEFQLGAEAGNSYYCYNIKGGVPALHEKPTPNSCCIDLGFKTSSSNSDKVKRALVFPYIDQITRTSYNNKSDPAWRLQRYNGYTDLMGGAEGVPAWRGGVNFYKNPMYGQQAMDYMLNGFMNNPWINKKVGEYQSKYGTPESVLCKGKNDGTYTIDSNYYFEQVKNTPKLEVIAKKIKSGSSFKSLTSRERNVLMGELIATAEKNPTMPKEDIGKDEAFALVASLEQKMGVGQLFPMVTAEKDVFLNQAKNATSLSQAQLNEAYNLFKTQEDIMNESTQNMQKINEAFAEIQVKPSYNAQVNELYFAILYKGQGFSEIKTKLEDALKGADEVEKKSIMENFKKICDYFQTNKKNEEKLKNLKPSFVLSEKDAFTVLPLMKKLQPLQAYTELYKERLKDEPALLEQLTNAYNKTNEKLNKLKIVPDYEKASKYYFDNLYQNRNTVGKSSNYSWEKLTDEQNSKLRDKLN